MQCNKFRAYCAQVSQREKTGWGIYFFFFNFIFKPQTGKNQSVSTLPLKNDARCVHLSKMNNKAQLLDYLTA